MNAPERIWAWVWNLPYPSRWQGKFSWGAVAYPDDQKVTEYIRADISAAKDARIAELERQLAEARDWALDEAADILVECSVWCDSQERTDAGWRNGVIDARKHHINRIRALKGAKP